MDADAQRRFHELWAKEPVRVGCRDIANTAKHRVLRSPPKTKAAVETTSLGVSIYRTPDGTLLQHPDSKPDILVLLSDSTSVSVFELTRDVLAFLQDFCRAHGVPLPDQPDAEFFGLGSEPPAT